MSKSYILMLRDRYVRAPTPVWKCLHCNLEAGHPRNIIATALNTTCSLRNKLKAHHWGMSNAGSDILNCKTIQHFFGIDVSLNNCSQTLRDMVPTLVQNTSSLGPSLPASSCKLGTSISRQSFTSSASWNLYRLQGETKVRCEWKNTCDKNMKPASVTQLCCVLFIYPHSLTVDFVMISKYIYIR